MCGRGGVEDCARNASAIATKGLIDEERGRKPEARASYTRALAIKPDLEDAKRGSNPPILGQLS